MKQKDLMQSSVLQQNRFFDNLPEQDFTTYQLKKPSKKLPLLTSDHGETKQRRRKQTHKLSSFISQLKPESVNVKLQLKASLIEEEAHVNCGKNVEGNCEEIYLEGMKVEEKNEKTVTQSIREVEVEKVTNKNLNKEIKNQQKIRQSSIQESNKQQTHNLIESNVLKPDENEDEKERYIKPAQVRKSINFCLSLDDSDEDDQKADTNQEKAPLEVTGKPKGRKKLKKVQYLRRQQLDLSAVDDIQPSCLFSSKGTTQSNTQEQRPVLIEHIVSSKMQNQSQNPSPVVSKQTKNDLNQPSKKPALLLNFDDEDDDSIQSQTDQDLETMQQICPDANQKSQKSALTNQKHQQLKNSLTKQNNANTNKLLINDFDDSQSQNSSKSNSKPILLKPSSMGSSHSISSNQQSINLTRPINILQFSRMTSSLTYVYEPVPPNSIFQSIIKRYQKPNQNNVVYEMFDQSTYKSIIKVRRVPEGFEMFSTNDALTVSWDGNSKNLPKVNQETSCGLLCPSFFGTQFNCFKFNRNNQKPDGSKLHRLITVNYETNLFGLNGPRRMQTYIPASNYLIKGEKSLQQAYESEKSLNPNEPPKIQTFINRKPRWNSEILSFVLNFNGRATVSSIKNFIVTRLSDSKKEPECQDNLVLFGKIQKNVFNLDIKHPFNLVQGLALALSSFDKKIACE